MDEDFIDGQPSPYSVYQPVMEQSAPGITKVINQQSQAGESWIDTAQRALTMLVMTNTQRQLMQINLERARQGLPPISGAQAGLSVGVEVGQDTRQLLMIGGVALLAVLFLSRR
ncbi:hypothetical protein EBS57_09745 [bacterium]|nr:hypothetical protein [bacterium]